MERNTSEKRKLTVWDSIQANPNETSIAFKTKKQNQTLYLAYKVVQKAGHKNVAFKGQFLCLNRATRTISVIKAQFKYKDGLENVTTLTFGHEALKCANERKDNPWEWGKNQYAAFEAMGFTREAYLKEFNLNTHKMKIQEVTHKCNVNEEGELTILPDEKVEGETIETLDESQMTSEKIEEITKKIGTINAETKQRITAYGKGDYNITLQMLV